MNNLTNTPCDGARLAAYLDGELSDADRAAVDAHLAVCAFCREALAEQREVKNALAAAPLPDGLHEQILAAVRREKAKARRRFFFTRLAAPCAAALLVAVLVPTLLRGGKMKASGDTAYIAPTNECSPTAPDTCDENRKNTNAYSNTGNTADQPTSDKGENAGTLDPTSLCANTVGVTAATEATGNDRYEVVVTLPVSRALYDKLCAALPDRLTETDGEIRLRDCPETRQFLCDEGLDLIDMNVTWFRLRIDDTN